MARVSQLLCELSLLLWQAPCEDCAKVEVLTCQPEVVEAKAVDSLRVLRATSHINSLRCLCFHPRQLQMLTLRTGQPLHRRKAVAAPHLHRCRFVSPRNRQLHARSRRLAAALRVQP
mmetsp:Transcript_47440/g.101552  ORF Transcript_47440/g.101552 Transcript_47440/m.101552 type:complete len:117 (+) Transcript_47440:235-585(+)